MQTGNNTAIVRTLRLHTDDFMTLGAGLPLDQTIKTYQGAEESSVESGRQRSA